MNIIIKQEAPISLSEYVFRIGNSCNQVVIVCWECGIICHVMYALMYVCVYVCVYILYKSITPNSILLSIPRLTDYIVHVISCLASFYPFTLFEVLVRCHLTLNSVTCICIYTCVMHTYTWYIHAYACTYIHACT